MKTFIFPTAKVRYGVEKVTVLWPDKPTAFDCTLIRVTATSDRDEDPELNVEVITGLENVKAQIKYEVSKRAVCIPMIPDMCGDYYNRERKAWHQRTATLFEDINGQVHPSLLGPEFVEYRRAFEQVREVDLERIATYERNLASSRRAYAKREKTEEIKQKIGALKALGVDVSSLKVPD